MYQVVQMVGTDGKNLLQLLPIPKSSGNLTSVVQSPVVSDVLKGNTGKPVQVTFQAQISSSSTSASIQLPIFQPADTTKYFLTKTVDTSGKGSVTPMGTGSFMPPVSKVESRGVKIDELNMQTFAVPPSTQNDSSHFVVNTPSLPVNVNSSVLPSGPHLQIPVHAEAKSIPESTLPSSVQQSIHATSTRSLSGTVETSQIPAVIYVSPVNEVTNRVTKSFQNIYPKPMILNTSKVPPNVATETQIKSGHLSETAQVKIIFQDTLQPCIPFLVPIKSSNNVASKISKTFIGRKNLGDNTVNTSLLNTISSNGTQSMSVPIKDNALVMLNGKVYLLTKEETHGVPSQNDQPNSVSSDNLPRKDSQVVSSSPGTEIFKELNSALIQSKSSQLETKSLSNSQLASMASLRAEKTESVERPSFSLANPHTVNQCSNYLKQSKTVFTNPVFPDGFRTVQNAPRKGNLIQSIEKICSSVDAATVTSQQCVFRDQELQTQCEMAPMLKKNTEERNNKKYSQGSNTKTDAEFKKLFGLTKELRVCLTRIPDCLGSIKGCDSFSSLMKNNSSYKDAEFVVKEEETKQSFSKKRKAKSIKKMDYTKRRKIKKASNTVMNGTDASSSQLLSILPTSDNPQHNIVASHSTTREDKRTEVENCSHEKQDKSILSSSASFGQSNCFSKSYMEDIFLLPPPELEETIRDEKIRRLKQIVREKEAALEEMRKKMHQKQ
ncbi:ligand-dependent nuclear receptor-interacting factor 1 isoform X1 [Phodopus roborovskii]|nr:ligand-dependent nuclear receptor-interacting factor 1 isoform X1 [Phodopus roborovskii]